MKTVVFQHIPKTAGSTIIDLLERRYTPEARFRIDSMNVKESLDHFINKTMEERNSYKLLYGHLSDRLIPYTENPVEIFTFLREPVDTFLSRYYYIKRATWNRFHEEVKNMKSVEEYIEFSIEKKIINNQTRYLSGDTDHLLYSGEPEKLVNEENLIKAKNRLSNIDHVYLMEHFDLSILDLSSKLGWKKMPFYLSHNTTSNRPKSDSLAPEVLQKLEKALAIDIELYNMAKTRFSSEVLSQNLPVEKFRSRNRWYQRLQLYRFNS